MIIGEILFGQERGRAGPRLHMRLEYANIGAKIISVTSRESNIRALLEGMASLWIEIIE